MTNTRAAGKAAFQDAIMHGGFVLRSTDWSAWLHQISWVYIRSPRALLHLNRLPIHTGFLNIPFPDSLIFPYLELWL